MIIIDNKRIQKFDKLISRVTSIKRVEYQYHITGIKWPVLAIPNQSCFSSAIYDIMKGNKTLFRDLFCDTITISFLFSSAFFIALFALFALVAANGNGRPACQTIAELGRDFRNHWDPTAFWRCEQLNQPAVAYRCEAEYGHTRGFMTDHGCVTWTVWNWEPVVNPPSLA